MQRWTGRPDRVAPIDAICDVPVRPTEMEFEIQFAHNGGLDKYHVHLRCFAAWEFERHSA